MVGGGLKERCIVVELSAALAQRVDSWLCKASRRDFYGPEVLDPSPKVPWIKALFRQYVYSSLHQHPPRLFSASAAGFQRGLAYRNERGGIPLPGVARYHPPGR